MTKTRKQVLKWLLVAIVFAVAVISVRSDEFKGLFDNSSETTRDAKRVVTEWLEAQRRGRDGYRFWSCTESSICPARLYSVRSWEIVDAKIVDAHDGPLGPVTVLVDSSTRRGIPISKTWRVELSRKDGETKITELKDLSEGLTSVRTVEGLFDNSMETTSLDSHSAARRARVVNEWLEAQRRGRDGRAFWSDEEVWVHPARLYSVRSWEIVDADWSGPVTVVVDSSTKVGIPISKTWRVGLREYGRELKITRLEDLSEDE